VRQGLAIILLAGIAAAGVIPAPAAASAPAAPAEASGIPVVLLVDSASGRVLHARQPDLRFVPASVTKVMSAYTAFGLITSGHLREDRMVTVPPAVAREWNGKGTSLYLQPGEQVPVELLIRGITTVSANDAAVVLALDQAGSLPRWAGLMNAQARALGMKDSRFATPNGWPDNGATYVSARDLVTLGHGLTRRYPVLYRRYFGRKTLTWRGVTQFNRDPLLGVTEGADGIKTGHTREAGYNFLGSAERDGRRLMLVVAGARSEAQRAAASRALIEWGYGVWRGEPLFPAGAIVGEARVQRGDALSVRLATSHAVGAVSPRGSEGPLALKLRYGGPIVAPIRRGQEVARLVIRNRDGVESTVPLVAAEAVGRAGPLDRLRNGLYGLLPW
jgi:serine-type D-Ala-D-Ala carboxypeptidase (penicillin-binding protein 5/6)